MLHWDYCILYTVYCMHVYTAYLYCISILHIYSFDYLFTLSPLCTACSSPSCPCLSKLLDHNVKATWAWIRDSSLAKSHIRHMGNVQELPNHKEKFNLGQSRTEINWKNWKNWKHWKNWKTLFAFLLFFVSFRFFLFLFVSFRFFSFLGCPKSFCGSEWLWGFYPSPSTSLRARLVSVRVVKARNVWKSEIEKLQRYCKDMSDIGHRYRLIIKIRAMNGWMGR